LRLGAVMGARVLGVGLVFLAMLAVAPQAHAQDVKARPKIEVVPNIPHASIRSVAFSPDGRRVLSGSWDHTIKLWDPATGTLLRTFVGHSSGVDAVAFSPDGAHVLSGGMDNTVRLWDAVTGALLRTFEGHSKAVNSVAFSADGAGVLSGSSDKTIRLWDRATGAPLRIFKGHSGEVWSAALSADGARVLSGSSDRTVRLWDAATGALLRTFKGHSGRVWSVAFSPDGGRVLSGSSDRTVRLWDAATGAPLHTLEGHSGEVVSVAVSPDGRRVLSGGRDNVVRLWDAATGALRRTFQGHASWIWSVAFSPAGDQVLSGSLDRTIRLWDAATGVPLRILEGHDGSVWSAAFSPDGVRAAATSDTSVRLWDTSTGALLRTFQGHSSPVASVAVSRDGTRILSGGGYFAKGKGDKTAKLWDAATGALLRSFEGHARHRLSVAFSPDGARVLSGGWDKTIRLWDTATGAPLRTFEGYSEMVNSVAFSLDGSRALSGDTAVKLWDPATGGLLRTFPGHSGTVWSVAFSPDGARVLSGGSDTTVRLWDTAAGTLLRTFEGHAGLVHSVAFSPDGARVLSGGEDKTARLWDAATGALLHTFAGHSGTVSSVAFSPDGRRALSGSVDTTLRIWDADTGAERATLIGAPDGRWLALTPAGFFASSGSAGDLLGIVRGLDATAIDQVHQSLFNPDLVREALAGDPGGEVAEAATVISLEKVLDSGPAPQVAIASPAPGSQSTADLVTVTARIEDRGKGVGRIEWRVNGVTAAVAGRPEGGGPVYTIARDLALDPGDNTIEVIAYNGSNLLASPPARTAVKLTGPADKMRPSLHILAIGINAYVDRGWAPPGKGPLAFEPLGLAVKDATIFADSMKKAAAGLYESVRVTLALDQDAARANLHRLIDKVAAEVHPRDSFILFAAAHGDAEDGRFYLIPQDYQSGPKGTLAQRAIGQDDLQDWLANRIKARKAIILLDTCESGSLIAGHRRSRVDTAASEAGVGRIHEATGRPVLTAAAAGQAAGEGSIAGSREGHGYFTWAVLDALRHGDANGNGLIELTELAAHVQSIVPKIAAGIAVRAAVVDPMSGNQTARFGSRGEDFAVARRLH
jgi:WD40 repeat protein